MKELTPKVYISLCRYYLLHSIGVVLFLLSVTWLAEADIVVLRDRDSFSGRVLRIDDGILVFRTAHAGQLMAPMDTLRSLSTESNLMITLDDARILYGRLDGGDTQKLIPLDGTEPLQLELASIVDAIVIPADARPLEEPSNLEEWRSALGVGLQFRSGACDSLEPYTHIEATREREQGTVGGELRLERADPDDFPAWLRGSLTWERTGEERTLYPQASLSLVRDTDNVLSWRTDLSLGFAYPFSYSEEQTLEALMGLNLDYEVWDAAALRDRQGNRIYLEDLRHSGLHLNVQLGLRYSRALWDGRATIKESLVAYPSLTDLGDLRLRSETMLRMEVTPRLRLRFDLMIDFDNRPDYTGYTDWITTIGAGFEYRF